MQTKINRRNFLKKSGQAGIACCALMMTSKLIAGNNMGKLINNEEINPKKLNFCGHTCPIDCKFLIATVENDETLKKEVFENWKIKARYGVDYDSEKAICWKCKNMIKPEGVVIQNCTVRACAIEKGYEACIECDNLTTCDKDLWKLFTDFHKSIIEIQMKYNQQLG